MNDAATSNLIAAYWAQEPIGANQEYPGKLEILGQLEELGDEEVTEFYLEVLAREDYDLARIEVLEILKFRAVPQQDRAGVGRAIINVMLTDADADTRTYATESLFAYMNTPGAFEALNIVLTDPNLGLNQRFAAFTPLERSGYSSQAAEILRRVISDPELSRSALRILIHWSAETRT